eukprot:TRINITY_DN20374_c0_g1_i1.p1 TRINITY_DN20374_c0_g1~~TRINITY_DN20374_c0_g1_i1.p1  ORF type:complete len:563 (-),score=47.78 TRINITY_DN20374_c0_g1_i1:286-1821(-)
MSLLRGTPSTNVLRNFASVLSDAPCKTSYYDLSAPVEHIDTFISHNWSIGRFDKFLALVLHFNLLPAVVLALSASFLCYCLALCGVLSRFHVVQQPEQTTIYHPVYTSRLAGLLTFLVTLFSWHELLFLVGIHGSATFLDKTCVHQTDVTLKRRGIEKLAAFLFRSNNMLVLYSDVYLQKLWTVYEICTYLILFPSRFPILRPLFMPKVVVFSIVTVCIYQITEVLGNIIVVSIEPMEFGSYGSLQDPFEMQVWIFWACHFLFWFVSAMACRRWSEEQTQMRSRLEHFSIQAADCFCEEDRQVVESNIITFATYFQLADRGSDRDDTLASFDNLVRCRVPQALEASIGITGIPYTYAVLIFGISMLEGLDVALFHTHFLCMNATPSAILMLHVGTILHYSTNALVVGPLCFALCSWLSMRSLRFQSNSSSLCVIVVGLASACVYGLAHVFMRSLLHYLHDCRTFRFGILHICICIMMIWAAHSILKRSSGFASDDVSTSDSECSDEADCSA